MPCIGDATENDWSTATEPAASTCSRSMSGRARAGHREAKQIAAAIRAALDGAALSLTGFALVDLRFLTADYARQPDGDTWRGHRCRFPRRDRTAIGEHP